MWLSTVFNQSSRVITSSKCQRSLEGLDFLGLAKSEGYGKMNVQMMLCVLYRNRPIYMLYLAAAAICPL